MEAAGKADDDQAVMDLIEIALEGATVGQQNDILTKIGVPENILNALQFVRLSSALDF